MQNCLIFVFCVFFSLNFKHSTAYYYLWEQDIFVEKNSHILINLTSIDDLVSNHILETSGDLQISLVLMNLFNKINSLFAQKYSNDNAIFDIFLLDKSGYDCYVNSLNSLGEQTSTCPFVTVSTQSFLKQSHATIPLRNLSSNYRNIVIDNTKFPEDSGAYHFSQLELKCGVNLIIIASSTFYNLFIACNIN